MAPTKLLTTDQAAELLQLAPGTLENWRIRRLGPPFLRLTRRCVRYDQLKLLDWIGKHAVESIPA